MKLVRQLLTILIICIASLLLCSCGNDVQESTEQSDIFSGYEIKLNDDVIRVSTEATSTSICKHYTYSSKEATFVDIYRSFTKYQTSPCYDVKSDAIVRYFDENGEWHRCNITDKIPYAPCYFIDDENMHYWVYSPREYKPLNNHSVKLVSENQGGIYFMPDNNTDYYLFCNTIGLNDNNYVDYILVASENPLFVWDKADLKVENFMKLYGLTGNGHWCFDGYYFKAAESYVPSGDDVLYFCVDSYIIKSFNAGTRYYGCRLILPAMIDTMINHQTEEGYLPTYSFSSWLNEDYGIDAGFYDTRFNTDFWGYVLDFYNDFGGDTFYEALEKYGQFFLKHATRHRIATENGYFVSDYYDPNGDDLTHASLNHNIAEAQLCIRLSEFFNNPEYREVADNIVKAIEDTDDQWIMRDNNLEYAICPDNSFDYEDYPYLTYNDLYDMQYMFERMGLERNPSFEKLMKAKKLWMDANGIKDYKK